MHHRTHRLWFSRSAFLAIAGLVQLAGCKSRERAAEPSPTAVYVAADSIGSSDFDVAREETQPGTVRADALAALEKRLGSAHEHDDARHTWRRLDGETCFELIATFSDDKVKAVEVHRITKDRLTRYRACTGPLKAPEHGSTR